MKKPIGPTRLILINCGKFDYAEINLDVPLHLVGPNNIGKTSLIAVLQYLYIDQQNKMHFSRDLPTSRKYYFPDISSFAIFESLSPEGFMITGVHGLGPVRQHEIERFSYQGRFDRDHFISQDNNIRPWDQIKASLASKGYTGLRPGDLRAALIGNDGKKRRADNNSVNLSLVPLNRRDEYDRFCNVFLNLLRLSHLRQDELKTLLLQLYEGKFTKKKIDLRDQFAPQLDQLQRQKMDVWDLKRNELAIRQILDRVRRRDEMRGQLRSLYSQIGQTFTLYKKEMNVVRESYENQLGAYQLQADQNELDLQSLSKEKAEKLKEQGSLQQKQKDFHELERRFCDFQSEWTNARISELEGNIRSMQSNLVMARYESPDAIERRLASDERSLEQFKLQLNNIDNLLVTSLMEHFDKEQIDKLSRLFNDDILRLCTQGKNSTAQIHNYEVLNKYIALITGNFNDNVYFDKAVRLDLAHVRHFDPEEFINPERIRERISYYENLIAQTKDILHAARHQQELTKQCNDLKLQLHNFQNQCAQYCIYLEKKAESSNLTTALLRIQGELDKLEDQFSEVSAKQKQIAEQQMKLRHEREQLRSRLSEIEHKIAGLDLPQDDWPQIDHNCRKTDLADIIDYYSRLTTEQQNLAERIEGELETLHAQTYDRYQTHTEKESLELFENELETLDEKQKALEENWASFTVQLKKDFRELSRDLEKLLAEVTKLNTQLGKVHISNLSNLKIIVLTRPELKRYFTQVEDSEDTPLFANSSQTEEVIRKISRILQEKPVISLEDMFDMHFEITTPNGETKRYDHLDRIESNGTTITIKVLINLILLRGLLSNDNVYIPFYLDECSSLDGTNLRSIVQQAREIGFIAVLASPEAMDAADHLYYLSEYKGRVTLNPQTSLVEIVREPAEEI